MGWLRRANVRLKGETDSDWLVKQTIARQLARLLVKFKLPLFKQWPKDKYNWFADSLTRDAYYLPADTHSLFLSIIQRVGKWSSMAFLEYIREQVDAFTAGVSDKMLQFESFHTLNQNEGNDVIDYTPVVNGDGEEKVPYTVHFSDIVLQDDELDIEMKGMEQDS